jgi:SPX domain protein involved in polyphosphate accumulation
VDGGCNKSDDVTTHENGKWKEIPFFSEAVSTVIFSLLELYQHLRTTVHHDHERVSSKRNTLTFLISISFSTQRTVSTFVMTQNVAVNV